MGVSGVQARGMDGGIAREWESLVERYRRMSGTSGALADKEVQEVSCPEFALIVIAWLIRYRFLPRFRLTSSSFLNGEVNREVIYYRISWARSLAVAVAVDRRDEVPLGPAEI